MRGSDSERMMAEIEAFLRTGEAPPAAPEPRPVASVPPEAPPDPFAVPLDEGPLSRAGRRLAWMNPFRRGLPLGRPPRRSWSGRGRSVGGAGGRMPADPWDRPAGRGRAGTPFEPPRWSVLRVLLVAGMLAALLVLPTLWPVHSSGAKGSSGSNGADRASAAPAGTGYAFLQRNRSGTPVRWDPCQPVYYVTNLAAAPAYAAADLQTAVSRISRATGIMFVDRGSTTTFPGGGAAINPSGPAGPVVIAWADAAQTPRIDFPTGASGADALARTEPIAETNQSSGHGVYVTGTVLISSAADRLPRGFGPGGLGVLLLHELGHLMGLGNVPASGQVMNDKVLSSSTTSLGAGDVAGLKRLGASSGCLAIPSTGTFQPS